MSASEIDLENLNMEGRPSGAAFLFLQHIQSCFDPDLTKVIVTVDDRPESDKTLPSLLGSLTGALEAKSLSHPPHNISKHGFGFFLGEVIATAFTSPLFMGKLLLP